MAKYIVARKKKHRGKPKDEDLRRGGKLFTYFPCKVCGCKTFWLDHKTATTTCKECKATT